MVSTKQMRGSMPANISRMPASQQMMTIELVLAFVKDGEPVAPPVAYRLELPRPPKNKSARLQVALDAQALADLLAPHVSTTKKPGLWVPGRS